MLVFTFEELERRVSTARAATYLAAAERDKGRALALYEWHVELTGALFSVVAGVEIVLRNAMHDQLTIYHDTLRPTSEVQYRWFDEPRWLPSRSRRLGWFTDEALKDIATAKRRVKDWRPAPNRVPADRVVAELSFGFWKYLLAPHYQHSFWSPALQHAFPAAPRGVTANEARNRVFRPVEQLHALRNRLAHHEPVFGAIKIARQPPVFVDVATVLDESLEVVGWIDALTATWIESRSKVRDVLSHRP
jgi:hypothetical protein